MLVRGSRNGFDSLDLCFHCADYQASSRLTLAGLERQKRDGAVKSLGKIIFHDKRYSCGHVVATNHAPPSSSIRRCNAQSALNVHFTYTAQLMHGKKRARPSR